MKKSFEKSFDALFRKSFNGSKLQNTLTNALARIAILKKQHQERCSQARMDIIRLVNLDHHESTVLRVDHMIREQNLLDALVIIESYCMLLMERVDLITSSIECPEEFKEATSSVIFAASRYGQLPELQKISRIFTKKYGKEFINNVNDLRNNCGVNPKIAKKLQTRTSLGSRTKILKEISAEHKNTLQLQGKDSDATQESAEENANLEANNKYKDVQEAAQASFELAAQAVVAAKVVVELLPDNDNKEQNLDENAPLEEINQEEEEAELPKIDVLGASFGSLSIQIGNESFRSENTEASDFSFPSVAGSEKQMIFFKKPGENKIMNRDESKIKSSHKDKKKFSSFISEFLKFKNSDAGKNEGNSNESINEGSVNKTKDGSGRGRRPISVRTRRVRDDYSSRGKRPVYTRP